MRHCLCLALSLATLVGCGSRLRHIAVDRVPVGKVVVYRNGVAYYERRAHVTAGSLTVRVPRERVDDFLKSLTVIDENTKQPLPVAFPRRQADDAAVIAMELQVGDGKNTDADVRMTYVTDAVAWKPSYRLTLGDGDAMLEGWAVVDNLSGEDWRRVEVGVGSSAAMSFRYDLWSVRTVDREELAGDEAFATAPPTAVSPYGGTGATAPAQNLLTLDASEIRETGAPGAGALASTMRPLDPTVETRPGTGAVAGVIVDRASGDVVAGATVVAEGPTLKAPQTVISEDDGRYVLRDLPPGTYVVKVFFGDNQFARPNLLVTGGKQTSANIRIDASTNAEVIELVGRAPVIDTSSTKQGVTITDDYTSDVPRPGRSFSTTLASPPPRTGDSYGVAFSAPPVDPHQSVRLGDAKLAAVANDLIKQRRYVVVQGYATSVEANPTAAALERANLVRNQLIDAGVAPGRVRVESAGIAASASVQIVTEVGPATAAASGPRSSADTTDGTPIGESLFSSDQPMTVANGSSAMVSVLRARTSGRPVYLYDGDGERGNTRFAFKAVRLDNPTDQTLEAGPITVYGQDRYVGEGLTDTVAPRASVVIPYALDRQIVVDRDGGVHDELARLVTIERGILTAEVQHLRTTDLTLTNRSTAATTVYVRHAIEPGWTLLDPELPTERLGDATLIAVDLEPGQTREVTLRDATPLTRKLELNTTETLDQLKLFVASSHPSPELRGQLTAILALHAELFDEIERIATLREHAAEYRERQAELTAQLVELRKLKSATSLSRHLADKAAEISTRLQDTTVAIIEAQDKVLLLRVKFQDALAELHLDDARATVARSVERPRD